MRRDFEKGRKEGSGMRTGWKTASNESAGVVLGIFVCYFNL